jgi:hypothetical protein
MKQDPVYIQKVNHLNGNVKHIIHFLLQCLLKYFFSDKYVLGFPWVTHRNTHRSYVKWLLEFVSQNEILNDMPWQFFIKFFSVRFHEYATSSSIVISCMETDWQSRYDRPSARVQLLLQWSTNNCKQSNLCRDSREYIVFHNKLQNNPYEWKMLVFVYIFQEYPAKCF